MPNDAITHEKHLVLKWRDSADQAIAFGQQSSDGARLHHMLRYGPLANLKLFEGLWLDTSGASKSCAGPGKVVPRWNLLSPAPLTRFDINSQYDMKSSAGHNGTDERGASMGTKTTICFAHRD